MSSPKAVFQSIATESTLSFPNAPLSPFFTRFPTDFTFSLPNAPFSPFLASVSHVLRSFPVPRLELREFWVPVALERRKSSPKAVCFGFRWHWRVVSPPPKPFFTRFQQVPHFHCRTHRSHQKLPGFGPFGPFLASTFVPLTTSYLLQLLAPIVASIRYRSRLLYQMLLLLARFMP